MRSLDFLGRPIGELILPDAQILVPAAAVRGWRVPPADLRALTTWGLPAIGTDLLVPDPQPARHDRRYQGEETYRLAAEWGTPVCVVAGSGRVVRLGPTPMFVNSTVAAFVASAWYYLWLIRQEGGRADDETFDLLDIFLARMQDIDPAIGADPESSFWPSVVEHW